MRKAAELGSVSCCTLGRNNTSIMTVFFLILYPFCRGYPLLHDSDSESNPSPKLIADDTKKAEKSQKKSNSTRVSSENGYPSK